MRSPARSCGASEPTRVNQGFIGSAGPTADRLAAADQASAGRPAAVGHPDQASADRPVAVGRLAADQAFGSDSDSWFFLSNVASPLRSLVFHGRSQSAANPFRSRIHIEAMCPELVPACRVPIATRRADDGTLLASVAAWGTNSDSGADLAFRWPSLGA